MTARFAGPLSSNPAMLAVQMAEQMTTVEYMYSIWPVPPSPSTLLKFMFYATGAPTSATHIMGRFPRYRTNETKYGYYPYEMRYTNHGAELYWVTDQGAYNLLRYWGFGMGYYNEEADDEESIVEEATRQEMTHVPAENVLDGDLEQPDAQHVHAAGSAAENPRMTGARSAGEGISK